MTAGHDVDTAKCTYVVNQASGQACGRLYPWRIFIRVGTGRLLQQAPVLRCSLHLGETVDYYATSGYPTFLDSVSGPAGSEAEFVHDRSG